MNGCMKYCEKVVITKGEMRTLEAYFRIHQESGGHMHHEYQGAAEWCKQFRNTDMDTYSYYDLHQEVRKTTSLWLYNHEGKLSKEEILLLEQFILKLRPMQLYFANTTIYVNCHSMSKSDEQVRAAFTEIMSPTLGWSKWYDCYRPNIYQCEQIVKNLQRILEVGIDNQVHTLSSKIFTTWKQACKVLAFLKQEAAWKQYSKPLGE